MSNCTRQEQILQLINEVQATLDEIFMQMDKKESLVHVQNNPSLVELMEETENNVKTFQEILNSKVQ